MKTKVQQDKENAMMAGSTPHRPFPEPSKGDTKPSQGDPRDEETRRRRKAWLELQRLKEDRRRSWTPWLLLRYTETDLGLRPLPNGAAFWESPDLWVESSANNPDSAVAGEPNFVHARVFNLGKADAMPVRVDFYWADPSVGLGPSNMSLIGTEWKIVPARSALDVRCSKPWVPIYLNDGHECLMVNCSNPILDPITAPFHPRQDRHVGQRNISVRAAQPGEILELPLMINNLLPMRAAFELTATLQHLTVDRALAKRMSHFDLINRALGLGQAADNTPQGLAERFHKGSPQAAEARQMATFLGGFSRGREVWFEGIELLPTQGRMTLGVHTQLMEHQRMAPAPEAKTFLARTLYGATSLRASVEPAMVLHRVVSEPAQQHRLTLRLFAPPSAQSGEVLICRIDQRWEGICIGGYTTVATIQPAEASGASQ